MIDEDERGALTVVERDWRPDGANSCQVYVARDDGSNRTIAWCSNGYGDDDFANALHIARHDPARVLREVEAKRKIIDRHHPETYSFAEVGDAGDRFERSVIGCAQCTYDGLDPEPWPCADVRDLAAIFSDRPGYREEWRP
jgi:hypothetical protein